MRMILYTGCALLLLTGCTGKVETQTEATSEQVEDLDRRILALETQIADLNRQLAAKAEPTATVAAVPESTTPLPAQVPVELSTALAEQVNALVLSQLEATVDRRIASQVGTAEDIQAFFSEVVDNEIDTRQEAERREQEAQRLRRAAERDRRGIQEIVASAGLAEDIQEAVLAARSEMQERLNEQLPILKERGATTVELLAAVAESRETYEARLLKIMDASELQSYYGANRWVQRDQSALEKLNTDLKLDAQQLARVADAYAMRRNTLSDGFLLMSTGYLDRGDVHDGFEQSQASFNDAMKQTLTPEQYSTFEESGGARFWTPRFGRRNH